MGDCDQIREDYIQLLLKTLTYSLWDEPLRPLSMRTVRHKPTAETLKRIDAELRPFSAEVAFADKPSEEDRRTGRFWPVQAHTMTGELRLQNVREAVETVLAEDVPGDLIETGVWRGGTCIFMRGLLKAHGCTDRIVHVADSFAGLPLPDPSYPADTGNILHEFAELAIPRSAVEDNFRRYGLLDDQVRFVEGFFSETLHKLEAERFAIVRLDGDMYSSTIQALEALYPKLSPGGFCIIDDYALKTCAKAVDDFRAEHAITEAMQRIDWTGMYWRKSR
jgi:O-methyltransferase